MDFPYSRLPGNGSGSSTGVSPGQAPQRNSGTSGPSLRKYGSSGSLTRNDSWGGIFRLKHSDSHSRGVSSLPRCLTFWQLVPLGVGSTIGAGVYVLIGSAARDHTGPALPWAFLIAGMASGLAAFCYAELASRCPSAGSAYHYAYTTVGEVVAWLIGWALILEYTIGGAAVARGVSPNLAVLFGGDSFMPFFLQRYPIHNTPFVLDPCAALLVLLISVMLAGGIKESARFQMFITLANVLILSLVVAVGIWIGVKHGWPGYSYPIRYLPYGVNGLLGGAAMVFYSFIGFDTVASTAEEVKRPQLDLPLGIGLSLLICGSLYMAASTVLVGIVPYFQIDRDTPMAHAFQRYHITWAMYFVSAGALAALVTTLLGTLLPLPRILMVMGRDGLLPPWFSRIRASSSVPLNATIVTGALASTLALCLTIEQLSAMISVGTLSAFTVVSVAVLILRYVPPTLPLPTPSPSFSDLPSTSSSSSLLSAGPSGAGSLPARPITVQQGAPPSLPPPATAASLPSSAIPVAPFSSATSSKFSLHTKSNTSSRTAGAGGGSISRPITGGKGAGSEAGGRRGVFANIGSPESFTASPSPVMVVSSIDEFSSLLEFTPPPDNIVPMNSGQEEGNSKEGVISLLQTGGEGDSYSDLSLREGDVGAVGKQVGESVQRQPRAGETGAVVTRAVVAAAATVRASVGPAIVVPVQPHALSPAAATAAASPAADATAFSAPIPATVLIAAAMTSAVVVESEEERETRRSIAAWSIAAAVSGVVLVSVCSSSHLPDLLHWPLALTGGVFLVAGTSILSVTKQDEGRHTFGTPGGFMCPCVPFLPIGSMLVNVHLMVNLGLGTWLRCSIWLLIGVFVYLGYGIRHSALASRPGPRVLDGLKRSESWWRMPTAYSDWINQTVKKSRLNARLGSFSNSSNRG